MGYAHGDPFFLDPEIQNAYLVRAEDLRTQIANLYDEYNPKFHDSMIDELARSEMLVEKWERIVANDEEESPAIFNLLKDERVHLRRLRHDLETSLGRMRDAKRTSGGQNINVQVVNQQVYQLVNLLREMADLIPEEKKEAFYKELDRMEVGGNGQAV